MSESASIGFVKNNMEVFGFSNDDQAMITSFLELLDNAIDAVLGTSIVDGSRMIDCSVTQSSTEGEYSFIVIDNGNHRDAI